MTRRGFVLAPILAGGSACGYRIAGTADTLPKTVKTIAVPPFTNPTVRYRLTDRLPALIAREFLTRTRYQIVQRQEDADAVLSGSINQVIAFPTIFDPTTGRAAAVEMLVLLNVQLRARGNATPLYSRQGWAIRQRYEISIDPAQYFDESSAAFERLSTDIARTVVSGVLENF